MSAKIYKFPENPAESEKITINLGFVDLGHIDLLVRDGFYSNRTDFIRTSIPISCRSILSNPKNQLVAKL